MIKNTFIKRITAALLSVSIISLISVPSFASTNNNECAALNELSKTNVSYLKDTTNYAIPKSDNGVYVQQSVTEILKKRPDLKDKIYKILQEKNALNIDGSIKNDAQIQSSNIAENNVFLGTGTEYTYAGRTPAKSSMLADWTKVTIWSASNNSTGSQVFNITNSFTQGCTVSAEVGISSTAALSSVLSMTAGVTLTFSVSASATQEYGATITLPAKTKGTIKGTAYVVCYNFRQKHYIFGKLISDDPVKVYVPTGVNWDYSQTKI